VVEDPRASSRARAVRPLNAPVEVRVRADGSGRPAAVWLSRAWQGVASVEDVWKVDDEWWRGQEQRIERVYFEVLLEGGRRVTVFHDVVRGAWWRQAG